MNKFLFREPPLSSKELAELSDTERADQLILESTQIAQTMRKLIQRSDDLTRQQSALTSALIRAAKSIGLAEEDLFNGEVTNGESSSSDQ